MPLVHGSRFVQMITTGARTGASREVEISVHEHGDGLFVIGTNFGRPNHPGWYHNIQANPDVQVIIDGRAHALRARVAQGEERARLLAIGKRRFAGYAEFERRSGRTVPVVVFEPPAGS